MRSGVVLAKGHWPGRRHCQESSGWNVARSGKPPFGETIRGGLTATLDPKRSASHALGLRCTASDARLHATTREAVLDPRLRIADPGLVHTGDVRADPPLHPQEIYPSRLLRM
jgi:hypothetical protein